MDTELKVDLNKKTATLALDYFFVEIDDAYERGTFVSGLSQIENLILSVNGNRVDVSILYDFSPHIPDNIWSMKENSFVTGFRDDSLSRYLENLCKETILEYVKKILPMVLKSLGESAKQFVERQT